MDVSVQVVDKQDEAQLRAWWEVGFAATADRPGVPWPPWEVSRRMLPKDNAEQDTELVTISDGDVAVAAGLLVLPRVENVHTAFVDAFVRPDRRRQGLGSAVVAALELRASQQARTSLLGEGFVPTGGTGPAEAFASAHGYQVASREAIKELALADFVARRESLNTAVGSAAQDYRLVTFDTVCPEEHLESFGRLLSMLLAEIPLGELDLTDEEWTPARLRDAEARNVSVGRHVLTALALAPDGSVAGSSDVRVNDDHRENGQVGITLVDPAHRGHRLGLALKIATHDLLISTYPECETVDTSNAEVNTHMNAVNEQLGYRSIETLLELHKRVQSDA
ncbi:MAG: GNAT family N-acetyltransferase [Nocardioides sp.]